MSTHSLTERYLAEDVYEDVGPPIRKTATVSQFPRKKCSVFSTPMGPKVLGMLEYDDTLPAEKRIHHREAIEANTKNPPCCTMFQMLVERVATPKKSPTVISDPLFATFCYFARFRFEDLRNQEATQVLKGLEISAALCLARPLGRFGNVATWLSLRTRSSLEIHL